MDECHFLSRFFLSFGCEPLEKNRGHHFAHPCGELLGFLLDGGKDEPNERFDTATSISGYASINTSTAKTLVYIRNSITTSAFGALAIRCWSSSNSSTEPYLINGTSITTSPNSIYSFPLYTGYNAFAIEACQGDPTNTMWFSTGAYQYTFGTIDGANPVTFTISAAPSSSQKNPTCTWLSRYQTTNSDSSYTTVMQKAGFFRIWVCRPSTAFGSSSSYESGYLWPLYVSDGTTTSGIVPKGYVVNSMWTGTGSTARIFMFYDVPASFQECNYRFDCRNDTASNGTILLSTALSTSTLKSDASLSGAVFYLTYSSSTLTHTHGSCSNSSLTLLKTVMNGYLTCSDNSLNGAGGFTAMDQTWFSTGTIQYARCTTTANTQVSSSTGLNNITGVEIADVDYNNGDYASGYTTPTYAATTTLAIKYAKLYQRSGSTVWGLMTVLGPIKENQESPVSTTLIIVGSSGGAGLLFIAGIYLFSRRKKKRSLTPKV